MFTCKDIVTGSKYLSKHLTANDYYEKGGEVVGRWVGDGAKMLGLEGKEIGHRDAAFEKLRTNRDPNTGEPWTPRTMSGRRAFYDFQISAPKDVSILAMTFGDKRLLAAHREAVEAGYAELQRFAARQTRDANGAHGVKVTGNLVTAGFDHNASQELDAQVHTHLVCMNGTYDAEEKRWYALENKEMFRGVALAGRVYQATLAHAVRRLGYEIVEERNAKGQIKGFTIEGVTEEDRDVQSTRSKQIEVEVEKFVAERGRKPTTKERHVIATQTRGPKLQEITTPEVHAKQRAKYSAKDIERLEAVIAKAKNRGPLPRSKREIQAMFEWALEHLFERRSVASEREILVCALENNLGHVTIAELRAELARTSKTVELASATKGQANDAGLHTTVANLLLEREMIAMVNSGCGICDRLGREGEFADGLSDDHRRAFKGALQTRDRAYAIQGPAGAGKSTLLRQLNSALLESNKTPIFVTPQHTGRITLEQAGYAQVATVTQFLLDLDSGRRQLDSSSVVIVDEAGQLSTRMGHALLKHVTAAGARMVPVGDIRQHTSVEAGDFLAILLKHSHIRTAQLTEIRRQQDPEYRAAMEAMSQGDVRLGLRMLDKQRRIYESKGEYLDRAADSYVEKTTAGVSTILVAPTWAEIEKMNARVRAGRKVRGAIDGGLKGEDVLVNIVDREDLSKAQKRVGRCYKPGQAISPLAARIGNLRKNTFYQVAHVDGDIVTLAHGQKIDVSKIGAKLDVGVPRTIRLAPGDLVLLQGNDRKLGVSNGMFGTVKKIEESGVTVDVRVGNEVKEVKLPPYYVKFNHGYAVTTHKSQSVTVGDAIVAGSVIGGAGIYVGSSRGTRDIEIHVPDKERLIASAPREIDPRPAAMDFIAADRVDSALAAAARRRHRSRRHWEHVQRAFRFTRVREVLEKVRQRVVGIGRA